MIGIRRKKISILSNSCIWFNLNEKIFLQLLQPNPRNYHFARTKHFIFNPILHNCCSRRFSSQIDIASPVCASIRIASSPVCASIRIASSQENVPTLFILLFNELSEKIPPEILKIFIYKLENNLKLSKTDKKGYGIGFQIQFLTDSFSNSNSNSNSFTNILRTKQHLSVQFTLCVGVSTLQCSLSIPRERTTSQQTTIVDSNFQS